MRSVIMLSRCRALVSTWKVYFPFLRALPSPLDVLALSGLLL